MYFRIFILVFCFVGYHRLALSQGRDPKLYSYDYVIDQQKDFPWWVFKGNYIYVNSSYNAEVTAIREAASGVSVPPEEPERKGIWMLKYDPKPVTPQSVGSLRFQLRHLLIRETWVTLIADPSVPIIFKEMDGNEVTRFWSDGKKWCDAIFDSKLHSTFWLQTPLPKQGQYVLVDKVVLGVMGMVKELKNETTVINPCLTEPLTMDDTPPDMEPKPKARENRLMPQQGDQIAPDMMKKENKPRTPTPTTETPAEESVTTRSFQTNRPGAKCDCVCTCASKQPMDNTTATERSTLAQNPRTG